MVALTISHPEAFRPYRGMLRLLLGDADVLHGTCWLVLVHHRLSYRLSVFFARMCSVILCNIIMIDGLLIFPLNIRSSIFSFCQSLLSLSS